MGKVTFTATFEDGESKSVTASIYDFIPIVKVYEKEDNNTILIDKKTENEILDLGLNVKSEYKNYNVPDITITKNEAVISLKIFNGNINSRLTDDDGLLEFFPSKDNISIEYESNTVYYEDIIEIKVKHTLEIGDKFSIDIKGKDNLDDFIKVSGKVFIAGKLNFIVKKFLTDIPSIVLCNFDCTENCEYSPDVDAEPPVLIWEEGIKNVLTKKGLELFSKTSQGRFLLKLFLKKGTNLFSINSESTGKFYNKHSLMFIENDFTNNFGHTEYGIRSRFPDYKTLKVSDYILRSTNNTSSQIKKDYDKYYMSIEIHLYINQFLITKKEENWSEERLIATVAHTIGHEIFIHAYRKGILCMEEWDNGFNKFDEIYHRKTGEHGNVDHIDYINNVNDKGLNLMRSYQEELKGLIGNNLFKKIQNYHDKKYSHFKKS